MLYQNPNVVEPALYTSLHVPPDSFLQPSLPSQIRTSATQSEKKKSCSTVKFYQFYSHSEYFV